MFSSVAFLTSFPFPFLMFAALDRLVSSLSFHVLSQFRDLWFLLFSFPSLCLLAFLLLLFWLFCVSVFGCFFLSFAFSVSSFSFVFGYLLLLPMPASACFFFLLRFSWLPFLAFWRPCFLAFLLSCPLLCFFLVALGLCASFSLFRGSFPFCFLCAWFVCLALFPSASGGLPSWVSYQGFGSRFPKLGFKLWLQTRVSNSDLK